MSISKTSHSDLVIVEFSDVHLGHHNTSTAHVIHSLMLLFPDNPTTADIDIIFIAGDVFDRRLSLPAPEVTLIKQWITHFLRLCKKHDIVVRISNGTPSHDWNQSKLFNELNELAEIGCDVRYVPGLEIEHIPRFNMDVLYIPDELNTLCDTTWLQVKALLATNNMEQVDYVIMHGQFPHQVPLNQHHSRQMHDPHRYMSICRQWVFVGHIHQYSQFDRILAAGSTDRHHHGDEGKKGIIWVQGTNIKFIVNQNAKRYLTVDLSGVPPEEAFRKLSDRISKLPEGSFVRIKAHRTDPIYAADLSTAFPYFTFTTQETGKVERPAFTTVTDNRTTLKRVSITRDNLADQLLARIAKKHPELVTTCSRLLSGVLND